MHLFILIYKYTRMSFNMNNIESHNEKSRDVSSVLVSQLRQCEPVMEEEASASCMQSAVDLSLNSKMLKLDDHDDNSKQSKSEKAHGEHFDIEADDKDTIPPKLSLERCDEGYCSSPGAFSVLSSSMVVNGSATTDMIVNDSATTDLQAEDGNSNIINNDGCIISPSTNNNHDGREPEFIAQAVLVPDTLDGTTSSTEGVLVGKEKSTEELETLRACANAESIEGKIVVSKRHVVICSVVVVCAIAIAVSVALLVEDNKEIGNESMINQTQHHVLKTFPNGTEYYASETDDDQHGLDPVENASQELNDQVRNRRKLTTRLITNQNFYDKKYSMKTAYDSDSDDEVEYEPRVVVRRRRR
jgi:hypothetical protein